MYPCTGKLSRASRPVTSGTAAPAVTLIRWWLRGRARAPRPGAPYVGQADWLAPSAQGEGWLIETVLTHCTRCKKANTLSFPSLQPAAPRDQRPIRAVLIRPRPGVRAESWFYAENTEHTMLDDYSITVCTFVLTHAVSDPAEHIWRAAETQNPTLQTNPPDKR